MFGTRVNCVGLWLLLAGMALSPNAAAQAGQLDPTFGNGGIVTTDFGDQPGSGNLASPNAVAIQSDGKIVVAGGSPGSDGFPVPTLARYNTNGSLDTAFGSNGIVTTPSIIDNAFTAMVLLSDGKILAAAGGFSADLVRYTSSGAIDTSFGTNGIVSIDFISGPQQCGLAVQPDGRILFADRNLYRLLSDGQFDNTFGNAGVAKTAGYPANALALLSDGKILVASLSAASGYVSRYNANGSLDTSFGTGGQMATLGTAVGVLPISSGDILIGGSLTNNSLAEQAGVVASSFAVSRVLAAGVTDAAFGANGGAITAVPNFPSVTTSGFALQSTGDIVALGTANVILTPVFSLVRYTPLGQLDTTFGNKGIVVTSFANGNQFPAVVANGLAIQSDNKIVAVGSYVIAVPHKGFDVAFKVLRYLGE